MERDKRNVLQRPAHPRASKAEGGWLRQANELLRREQCRELLADAKVKGVAARQHHDGTPPISPDLAERIAHGTGPCERPATNKIAREFQMPCTADDQLR